MARIILAAVMGFLVLVGRSEAQQARPAAPANPPSQARTDHLLYSIPAGWKQEERDQYTSVVPADLPQGMLVEIRLWPGKALGGATLNATANAELDRLKATFTQVQTMPLNPVRHEGGFDMVTTGASMASSPGSAQFVYDALCFVHTGDQVQKVQFIVNDFQLYQAQKMTFDRFLHDLRVTDSLVLAKGTPPLTQAKVDQVADFLEWLLDVPFTDEQRRMIAGNMIESWKKNDREEIKGIEDVVKFRAQLSGMSKEQKELARQAAQPELIKQARDETDPVAKMIVQVYDAAHQPIADGDPPLTRQATDAMLETLFFMASQVQGGAEVTPTPEMKGQWAKALAGSYGQADEAARKEMAQMPVRWAAMRMMWPGLSEQDKAATRAQWAQSPQVKQVAGVIGTLQPRPHQQQQPAAAGYGYIAQGKNVIHVNGPVTYVVFNLNSEKEAQERAAEMNKAYEPGDAGDPIAKHNRDYETTRSLLNVSMDCYRMQMSAISGVGSAGWHYQYR
jgi:hypothetical protein